MTKPSLSTLAMLACWLGLGAITCALWLAVVDFPQPGQFTLPMMFWTCYGLLLIVSLAAAIGLPTDQAAFWRTFVAANLTFYLTNYHQGNIYTQARLYELTAMVRWLRKLSEDQWKYHVVMTMGILCVALVAGSLAWLLRRIRPPREDRTFRFGILHLLLLSTLIACTCGILQRATNQTAEYVYTGGVAIQLLFAIAAGAGWGHPKFTWGFLLGCFGWTILMNHPQLAEEWATILPEALRNPRAGWPAQHHRALMRILLPLYAGLATGTLAGLLHRPQLEQRDATVA